MLLLRVMQEETSSTIIGHFIKGQEVGLMQIPANRVSDMAFE